MHRLAKGAGAPAVVLVSGGGMPGLFLAPVLERVAAATRALLYDRAGMGWSEPAPAPRSFAGHAQDLHDLLAAAGEQGPFVLVGESYGGLVVRAFAARWPAETAGLVLLDAAEEGHVFGKLDVLVGSARRQLGPARLLAALGVLRPLVRRSLSAVFDAETRERLAERLGRAAHWTAASREMEAYDLTPGHARTAGGFGALGDLPLTVIAHGRPMRGAEAALEDGWSEGQARLAALSSRGRLVVAERCGHAIAQQDPDLVAGEILALVDQVRAGA